MPRSIRNPVKSVELKVSIRADRATAEMIRSLFPSAKVRRGSFELKMFGEKPDDVAARAEELIEKLRGVVSPPKDFKNAERSQPQK